MIVSGFNDAVVLKSKFSTVYGLAIDDNDNLYIADTTNYAIRFISSKTTTTLAGNSIPGSLNDVNNNAMFSSVFDIATSSSGDIILISDTDNNLIRQIVCSDGYVMSYGICSSTPDPTIYPTFDPTFYPTFNPTFDPTFDPSHFPSLIPVTKPTPNPTNKPSSSPTISPTSYISYVSNIIVKSFLGHSTAPSNVNIDGLGDSTFFSQVFGLCLNPNPNILYVTSINSIRKVNLSSKQVSTITPSKNWYNLFEILFILCVIDSIFHSLSFCEVDVDGNIFLSDMNAVIKISNETTATVFAGNTLISGFIDGQGTSARFYKLQGLASDPWKHFLYLGDNGNGRLRIINYWNSTVQVTTMITGLTGIVDIVLDFTRQHIYASTVNCIIYRINTVLNISSLYAGSSKILFVISLFI